MELYIAFSKKLVHSYGALTTTTWIFIVAIIPTRRSAVASTLHTSFANVHFSFWLATLYILLIPTVLAYTSTRGPCRAWRQHRRVYIYLQPLIAFALAPLMLASHWVCAQYCHRC